MRKIAIFTRGQPGNCAVGPFFERISQYSDVLFPSLFATDLELLHTALGAESTPSSTEVVAPIRIGKNSASRAVNFLELSFE